MEFTGERYIPGQRGNIELEHLHRYSCAVTLAFGKDVLDIASGEGYGSAILARTARHVTGVDIASEAISHAQSKYLHNNLDFKLGSATEIPLPGASVDLVVSFETIEHHDQHDAMLAEIKRVLRPDGALLISSPNKRVYSEMPKYANPYHVKELTRCEFEDLLHRHFTHVALYSQRVVYGSVIVPEGSVTARAISYRKNGNDTTSDVGLIDPMYLIALASDVAIPPMASSVFEDYIEEHEAFGLAKSDLSAREAQVAHLHERIHALESELTTVVAESARLQESVETEKKELSARLQESLDAQRREFAESSSLRSQLIESDAVIRDLKRKNATLEAGIARLRDLASQFAAKVERYEQSWSWRLTAPVRLTTTIVRRVRCALLKSLRIAQFPLQDALAPIRDLRALAGGRFVATGNDPQFSLGSRLRRLSGGRALVTIDIADAQPPLRPILYAFSGDSASQTAAFHLPALSTGRIRELIVLPPDTKSLRLDPIDIAGARFKIANASVRNIGRLGVLRYSFSKMSASERRGILAAALRGDLATARKLVGDTLTDDGSAEYRSWVALYDTLTPDDSAAIKTKVTQMGRRPIISVVMAVYNPAPQYLRKALNSVIDQLYPDWELCIADDASSDPRIREILDEYAKRDSRIKVAYRAKKGHVCAASNTAIELVSGEYIALMDHDDVLPAHALYMVADELARHPETDLIYTDEDKINDRDERYNPHFKTDWNRELFYSQNIVAHLGVYRTSLVRKIDCFRTGFEGSQDYDFALRFVSQTDGSRIRHIPHVLYHWRIFPGVSSLSTDNPTKSVETARKALVEYFSHAEPNAEVVGFERFPGWWRIKRPAPTPRPQVSLIIPTRDRVDLLEVAVQGLLHETNYDNFELIIADNGSVAPETLRYLDALRRDARVKIIRVEGEFDFSRVNNRAAETASGSIVGFINNDIKVIHRDWLTELVAQVSQRNVAAVGARLYYQNDTVQHAGVILGLYGVAAHGHRHLPRQAVGYFGRPVLVQNVSAVTAACMLVQRSIFEQVGGFTEDYLPVGYNDVDLCLKIREAGYNIVFTPFAELYHLESASRGQNRSLQQLERDARERAYMLERWGDKIASDPFYNPNFTIDSENFGLAFPPRAPKPWSDVMSRSESPISPPAAARDRSAIEVIRRLAQRLLTRRIAQSGKVSEVDARWLENSQRQFDALYTVDDRTLRNVARSSSLIVVGISPFTNVSTVIDELAQETFAPGEVVVVDATAEIVRGTAIRAHAAIWRRKLPSIEITIVPYPHQDLRFPDALELGLINSRFQNVWIIGPDYLPAKRCLEYVFKSYIAEGQQAVIVAQTITTAGRFQQTEIPEQALGEIARNSVMTCDEFRLLDDSTHREPPAKPLLTACASFWSCIFGGSREQLSDPITGRVFDTLFQTDAAIADVSLRLRAQGTRVVRSIPSAAIRLRQSPLGTTASWEMIHDWRWLQDKHQTNRCISAERIELVCPFHRGDVLLAVQAAAYAASIGANVRLHVSEALLTWARDLSRDISVEPIPVPIASPKETYSQLLTSYRYVSQRPDASPRIARCHPSRSLSETDKHLLAYILGEMGLRTDIRLPNLKPPVSAAHRDLAAEKMQSFGNDVVFVHPIGGWGLKTIPDHLMPVLTKYAHDFGFKLIQLGGAADRRFQGCDGAILHDFLPSQWRAIFELGRALIGVDSWTAHFASVLNIPQVTLYGSTHPRHVHSKDWFAERTNPSLVFRPAVDCSPCNSLKCLAFSNRSYCTGYRIDGEALSNFLASLRRKSDGGTNRYKAV
jgi:glycosyltransferase involved in cell wall biosynthesis/SAM-dependent methyltransferase